MIYCNVPSETDTNLKFFMRYKSYSYASATDTSEKYILYKFDNNFSASPGELRISNTNVFKDEGVNKIQPYVKEYRDTIYDGFNGSSKVKLNGSNFFKGDTILLNFHIVPVSGTQYDMYCKYLKL